MAKPKKHTDEQIIEALEDSFGCVVRAAETLGYKNTESIYSRMKDNPKIKEFRERMISTGIETSKSLIKEALQTGSVKGQTLSGKDLLETAFKLLRYYDDEAGINVNVNDGRTEDEIKKSINELKGIIDKA
jgi:hypothetical protein